MHVIFHAHTRRALTAGLSALLLTGSIAACPQAAFAAGLSANEAAEVAAVSTQDGNTEALFFIAKLTDNSIKPNSQQELQGNLAGYSSRIVVEGALNNPETTIADAKFENFGKDGVTSYLCAFPTDQQIQAACPEFDPAQHVVLWYVVKLEPGDGWHVDGLLLNKSAVDPDDAGDSGAGDGDGNGSGTEPEGGQPEEGGADVTRPDANDGQGTPAPEDSTDATQGNISAPAIQDSLASANASASPEDPAAATRPATADNPAPVTDTAAAKPAATSQDNMVPDANAAAALSSSSPSPDATRPEEPDSSESIATTMRTIGAAGMIALAAVVLIATALSAAKSAAAKALEARLRSGNAKPRSRR